MRRIFVPILICSASILWGCSDQTIHIDKVREAFQGIPSEQKAKLEAGLSAVAASNYVAALPPLQAFAFGTKMDEPQRKILADTIAKVSAKARQQK